MSKRKGSHPLWSITLEDSTAFKLMIDALASIEVARARFTMTRGDDGGWTLGVRAADKNLVCVVIANLKIDIVNVLDEDCAHHEFCVGVSVTELCLRSIPSYHTVCIEAFPEDSQIVLRSFDAGSHSHQTVTRLKTYVDNGVIENLTDMMHTMTLEMDLGILKSILKSAKGMSAENVDIEVYIRTRGEAQVGTTRFRVETSDATYEQIFCKTAEVDPVDGSMRVVATADGSHNVNMDEHTEPNFRGVFAASHLEKFLEKIKSRKIVARVGDSVPMLILHPLAGEEDSVSLLRFYICQTDVE